MPYKDLVDGLLSVIPEYSCKILTLEEEIKAGGFGMMILDKLSEYKIMDNKKSSIIAIDGSFADKYGSDIYKTFGIDEYSIANRIKNM